MRTSRKIGIWGVFCALLLPVAVSAAEATWSREQRAVLSAIDRLSAATAPDGEGADAYAEVLADGFTRWTVGDEVIQEKEAWVAGLREWFEDGWRVSEREARVLEIRIDGEIAFVRRIVTEAYTGPASERSRSTAALVEVWVRRSGEWRLLRADVHPMDAS